MTAKNASLSFFNRQYYTDLVAPVDMYLKTVVLRGSDSTWASGLQIKMRIYKNKTTLEYDGSFVTSTGSGEDGKVIFNLTDADTSFSQGDAFAIGFNCTSAMGGVVAAMNFETI